MTKVVTVVQARYGSTRLPGKIFLPLLGKPLLVRMVDRVRSARLVGDVVVATTTEVVDDQIEALCVEQGLQCFRGSTNDLLDRHYQCGKNWGADVVLKIPSDCPLIDPRVIDRVIEAFFSQNVDYASNLHPQSYPDGQDVEVISFSTLEKAWREAKNDFEREHTTPYIWEHPDLFRITNILWETGKNLSMSHRITIDYPEDYQLICAVYQALYPLNPCFSLNDIVNFLDSRPDIFLLNSEYAGVNWYRHHLDQLTTISPTETKVI
jgi:spore coat polysaccharide biosynthesis protein SpsF